MTLASKFYNMSKSEVVAKIFSGCRLREILNCAFLKNVMIRYNYYQIV